MEQTGIEPVKAKSAKCQSLLNSLFYRRFHDRKKLIYQRKFDAVSANHDTNHDTKNASRGESAGKRGKYRVITISSTVIISYVDFSAK